MHQSFGRQAYWSWACLSKRGKHHQIRLSSMRFAFTPQHTQLHPAHFTLLRSQMLCNFSAKHDRCDSTTRCSDGLRRCNRGSMKFNTFAETIFLRLPRSYRVAEKSDPIDRFSGPDLQKITKNRWFLSNFSTTRHDRAKRRKTLVANVSKGRLPIL